MAIPKFLEDLMIISKLGDNPGADNGLTSSGLRGKFDEAGLKIQNYINNTLIPALPGHFAPAGYGLGTETVRRVTIAELDTLTSNGWYLVNNNKTGLTLNNEPFNWAICRVIGANDQWNVKQELYPIGVNNLKIIRAKETETTWYPWECDNPTLTPGVEYRTTERWDGKPVYAQRVNLGTLPNATSGAVSLPIIGAETFIDYNLVGTSTSNPQYQNLNTIDIELVFGFNDPGNANGSTWVDIHAKTNHSAYTGKLSVKYTKV